MDEKDLKGNSFASKNTTETSSINKQPITTNVVEKKKSKFDFLAPDAKNVGDYILTDVAIPSIKKLISDAIKGAIDWILYGRRGTKPNGIGQVSYNNFYVSSNAQTGYGANPMLNNRNNVYTINDFIFNDYGDAERVLISMKNCIAKYGCVKVGDFYDFIGKQPNNTDYSYGWDDLSATDIIRNSDGFSIRFPVPKALR